MKLGIVVAIAAACFLLVGLVLYYGWVGLAIEDIRVRLVTEAQLEHPDDAATIAAMKLAPYECSRVYDLRANPVARRLRGNEIRAMWQRCEHIADMASGLDKIEKRLPQ